MPTPEAIAVPDDGKEAINNFNEWLKTTKDWHKVPGYEDFYYCNDPQTESRLGQLRTNLDIPEGHARVYKIDGEKLLPLTCTRGPAYFYPLHIEPGASPRIGKNVGSLEYAISIGSGWKITELSYIRPPVVFLSINRA